MGAEGGDGIGAEGKEEVVGVGAGRARLERGEGSGDRLGKEEMPKLSVKKGPKREFCYY